MKLYEVDITSLWWIAAEDEFEATNLLRDELVYREISDEEMDEALDDLIINELTQDEAEMITVVDEYGSATSSLWALFMVMLSPGVITSDFDPDQLLDEDYDV